jgi:hypothetical protein
MTKRIEDTRGGKKIRDTETGHLLGSVSDAGKVAPTPSRNAAKPNWQPRLTPEEIKGGETDLSKLPAYKRFQLAIYEPSELEEALEILHETKIGDLYRAIYIGEGEKIATKFLTFADGTQFNHANDKFIEEGTITEESLAHLRAGEFDEDGIHFVLSSVEVFPAGSEVKTFYRDPNWTLESDPTYKAIWGAEAELIALSNDILSDPLFRPALAHFEQIVRRYGDESDISFLEEFILPSPYLKLSRFEECGRAQAMLITIGAIAGPFERRFDSDEYEVLTRLGDFTVGLTSLTKIKTVGESDTEDFISNRRLFLRDPDMLDNYCDDEGPSDK